jgi:hypothetical protein
MKINGTEDPEINPHISSQTILNKRAKKYTGERTAGNLDVQCIRLKIDPSHPIQKSIKMDQRH